MGETDWFQVATGACAASAVVVLGFVAWAIIDAACVRRRQRRRIEEIIRQIRRNRDAAREAYKILEGGDR